MRHRRSILLSAQAEGRAPATPVTARGLAELASPKRQSTPKAFGVDPTARIPVLGLIGELLLPNHARAKKAQHLIDWIRDRISAAAGVKQPDRTRIGRHVFHH